MDFILPSDDTMELMREEFAKMKPDSFARAFALANGDDISANMDGNTKKTECPSCNDACSDNPDREGREVQGTYIGPAIATVLLLLYFVKHLGYNNSYGTQIFNTYRGMEQIRPNPSHFGQLNDLD